MPVHWRRHLCAFCKQVQPTSWHSCNKRAGEQLVSLFVPSRKPWRVNRAWQEAMVLLSWFSKLAMPQYHQRTCEIFTESLSDKKLTISMTLPLLVHGDLFGEPWLCSPIINPSEWWSFRSMNLRDSFDSSSTLNLGNVSVAVGWNLT